MSDTTDISKCPKCGGARTHAEGGVSYGHCSSSWGVDWKTGVVTVYSQGMTCRIWELERELAEARRELVSQESECARLSVIVRDLNAQLAAHKAALNLCEMALNSDMYGTFTDLKFEALSAIAKLKGSQ